MQLVWDAELPQSRKFLLLSLADQANDAGECWPSITTIASRCSMGRRTVFDALAELEAEGWLDRQPLPGQRVAFHLNVSKLSQLPLAVRSTTGAKSAPVQKPQGCEIRTGADSSETGAAAAPTGARSALHKATPKNQQQPKGGVAHASTREEELQGLPRFDRELIAPYLDTLPPGVELPVFAAFAKHRKVIGRVLSISSWLQVVAVLKQLAAEGVDLNASLKETMALGLAKPVDPRSRGGAPPRRHADDFSSASYQGTADHELPDFLRANDSVDQG